MEPIRVMIVDDSAVYRGVMRQALAQGGEVQVVASATNGENALQELERCQVDVVLLDLEMPVMDGLTAIPRIQARAPLAKIVVASAYTSHGSERAVRALTSGAADCIQKPSTLGSGVSLEDYGRQLLAKVRQFARRPTAPAPAPAPLSIPPLLEATPEILVIGASTGGPNALSALFRLLPKKIPFPVLVVQHMPPGFTRMLAQRLQADCSIPCVEATHGQPIVPGTIYIAPGDHHMVIEGSTPNCTLKLTQDPPENFCRPAVDPLFRSAARVFGRGAAHWGFRVPVVASLAGLDAFGTIGRKIDGGRDVVAHAAGHARVRPPAPHEGAGDLDARGSAGGALHARTFRVLLLRRFFFPFSRGGPPSSRRSRFVPTR